MDDLHSCYRETGLIRQNFSFNDANDEITIIQLARNGVDDAVQCEVLKLRGVEKDAWLSADTAHSDQTILLQLLKVTFDPDFKRERGWLDLSRDNYNSVVAKFDIHKIIAYGQSSMQVYSQVPEDHGNAKCTYTAVNLTDYFSLFHKFHSDTGITQGIYWAGPTVLPFLHNSIFHQCASAGHPFFLTMCSAVAFEMALASRLSTVSDALAGIERRTGFKVWNLERFEPAKGDYPAISAAASGYATSLAANKRLNKLTRCMLMSFGRCIAANAGVMRKLEPQQADFVASRVDLLLQQNEVQLILIDFMITRVQNQLTALFNFITQEDTQVTISLARDSRTIATASKHDSTSMKTLAAVTVIFLPGTFIASLFSTTFFDWSAGTSNSVLNDRFWVYWVITLPLTMVTVAAWLLWTRRKEMLHREQELKAQEERIEYMGRAS